MRARYGGLSTYLGSLLGTHLQTSERTAGG
jgi:hypothetical protein